MSTRSLTRLLHALQPKAKSGALQLQHTSTAPLAGASIEDSEQELLTTAYLLTECENIVQRLSHHGIHTVEELYKHDLTALIELTQQFPFTLNAFLFLVGYQTAPKPMTVTQHKKRHDALTNTESDRLPLCLRSSFVTNFEVYSALITLIAILFAFCYVCSVL